MMTKAVKGFRLAEVDEQRVVTIQNALNNFGGKSTKSEVVAFALEFTEKMLVKPYEKDGQVSKNAFERLVRRYEIQSSAYQTILTKLEKLSDLQAKTPGAHQLAQLIEQSGSK